MATPAAWRSPGPCSTTALFGPSRPYYAVEGVHCVEHQFPVVLICSPQGDDSCCGGSFRKRHSDQFKSPVAQPRFRSASLQKLFAPAVAWEKDLKGKFLLHLALECKALKSTLLEVEMTAVTMKSPSNANSMLERLLSLRGDGGTALRKRKFSDNCANLLERSQRFAELLDACGMHAELAYAKFLRTKKASSFVILVRSGHTRSVELVSGLPRLRHYHCKDSVGMGRRRCSRITRVHM